MVALTMFNTLNQYFGFDSFRPGQEEVVSSILCGRSAAAIFPTGSGKSLCYQVPALHLPNLTLVVSPLLALMQDQVQFLRSKNIPAASIDSSLSRADVKAIMAQVRNGEIKILMIAVERLKNEGFRNFIRNIPISLLVVDEAHCISEWGHNFRPDYLKLPEYQKEFNIQQCLLLTATATPNVIEDMARKFRIYPDDIQVTGFYRPNLHLLVEGVSEQNKLAYLQNWLFHKARFKPQFRNEVRDKKNRDNHISPTIIYVTLQQTAEQVARYLNDAGFHAAAYHAGLDSERRQILQTEFMAGHVEIMVATIAFGMGIDKSNIRNVIHFDLPKSIENYSQEIGRAGRDGQSSDCLVLANRQGLQVLENFIYGDTPEVDAINYVLKDIRDKCERTPNETLWRCSTYTLSNDSNIRQLPLKTLLVYLEMAGILQSSFSYFADYKFKLLIGEEALLEKFTHERQAFVNCLLANSQRARTWWSIEIDNVVVAYHNLSGQCDRQRVIAALEYFSQQGWIELQAKQMTEVYRVLQPDFEQQAVCQHLIQLFQTKEQAEVARIHHMLELFERTECLSSQLAEYFGDHQAPNPCGHCSVCSGHKALLPKSELVFTPAALDYQSLTGELVRQHQAKFNQPPTALLITRFLCGISVPSLTKLKARKISGFGQLQEHSYRDVLQWVSEMSNYGKGERRA